MKVKRITFVLILLLGISGVMQADEIASIASKYRTWLVGSDQIDYTNPQIKKRYQAILKEIEAANEKYDNFDFTPDEPFDFSSKPNQNEARTIFSEILFPLSLGYHLPGDRALRNRDYQNPKTLKKILYVYDYLNKKGWREGIDMHYKYMDTYRETGVIGFGGSMGNNFLGYSLSVFLNKEVLAEKGRLEEELKTLNWITNVVGPAYDFPVLWEVNGYNADGVRAMFNNRFCYILTLPENQSQRAAEMAYFQCLLNKSLMIAEGWADLIKPDFMGYHHKGAYINAYAPNAFHTAALLIYLLEGSKYQVSPTAIENLSQAVLTTRVYSNKYDVPRGLSGRFPDNLDGLVRNLPAFAYLAAIENTYSDELTGAFKRLWDTSYSDFEPKFVQSVDCKIMYHGSMGAMELTTGFGHNNEVSAEATPQGYWYKPYGGLTIYRTGEAMVTWKGNSRYIWDFESSKTENIYGRYASAGVLRIYADGQPVSAKGSGYLDAGWNWSRLPGSTSFDLTLEQLKTRKTRNFTAQSFLGGVSMQDQMGMSAMIYEDPLSTLKAKESVFFFDDLVIALGSDISASEDGEVQTTLFQSGLTRDHDSLVVNGTNYSGVNHSINGIAGQNTFLSDPYNHLYYLPESGNLRIETARQKSKSDNGKKVTIGDFATARLVHGSRPKEAQYEYAIQIHGATKANNMSNIHPDQIYQVQRNDKTAHIVAYLPAKCTGFALFERHVKLDHTVLAHTDTPCLVMTREEGTDQLTICVTNPELGWTNETISFNAIKTRALWYAPSTLQPVHLTLQGQWQVSEPNEAVSVVSQEGNQTVIRFNCLDGATIQTQLKRD